MKQRPFTNWEVLLFLFGPPRGVIWVILYSLFIVIPYEFIMDIKAWITKKPRKMDFFSDGIIQTVRYLLSDRDMYRCRFYFSGVVSFHILYISIYLSNPMKNFI